MPKDKPEIRFAGYTDAWEERKLRDLLNKNSEKNKNLSVINVESVSNKTGFTKQTDQFEDYSVASADLSNYYVIREKQFAYNPSRINVGSIAYKDLGDEISVVSPLYVSFSTKKVLNDGFLWNWFKTASFDAQRQRLSEGGVRDTLSFNQLSEMNTMFPTYPEQEKIGSFFKLLDDTIALHQRKLDLLKEQKKGYLQKMFPKNGSKVPELRFAGFADAWEKRKFEQLLDSADGVRRGPFGSALKKDLFVESSNYVVYEQQNAIYDRYETRYHITEEKFKELKKFEIIPGDYIMSGAGTIGRISEVPSGIKQGVFNQALIRFRINLKKVDRKYFLAFMRGDIMQKKLTSANPGSAITNLVPMKEVKKYDIDIPSLDEQTKIGTLLNGIDRLITVNQRRVDLLKQEKKALLQKMFV